MLLGSPLPDIILNSVSATYLKMINKFEFSCHLSSIAGKEVLFSSALCF